MMENYMPRSSSTKALILFSLLVIFAGYLFLSTDEFTSIQKYTISDSYSLGMVIVALSLTLLTFVTMITSTSDSESNSIVDGTFIISAFTLTLLCLEIASFKYWFYPLLYLGIVLSLNFFIIYHTYQIMFTLLKITGKWPQIIGTTIGLLAISTCVSISDHISFKAMEETLALLRVISYLAIPLHAIISIILTYSVPSLRLSPNNIRQSLEQRFSINKENKTYMSIYYIAAVINTVACFAAVYFYIDKFNNSTLPTESVEIYYPLSPLNLAWIPFTYLVYTILRHEDQREIQRHSMTGLVSNQAKRFITRYYNQTHHSTTVGLRTANFMIDHDPQESMKALFPSYVVRTRQDQVRRMIRDIMSDALFDDRVVANQIYGAIDPEGSIRSCTDILLMFTTIFIDGIPMLERRLKNLARLLPILDEDLAEEMTPDSLESHFRSIQWFFHLDFDWIDQHMTNTCYRTDYEVSIDNIRLRDRQQIISIFEKHKLMGNFIWISERARDRITMEAPYLATIIEAWPISLKNDHSDKVEDSVIFLIKFDQLIPRLQKYYSLEATREKLRYFDPSTESRKLLNIIELEIQQAGSIKKILDVISLIDSYPWHGYQEKDLALDLVLKAQKKQISSGFESEKEEQYFTKSLVTAIRNIGYPSQEIHRAHQEKMRIREVDIIRKTLTSTKSDRFSEAWMLIATTQPGIYSKKEIVLLLETINKVCKDKSYYKNQIIVQKISEAYFNLTQELSREEIPLIQETCDNIASYLIHSEASPDIFCFFIDGKVFLESNMKTDLTLQQETLDQMQLFFSQIYDKNNSNTHIVSSLSMRWAILINQSRSSNFAS